MMNLFQKGVYLILCIQTLVIFYFIHSTRQRNYGSQSDMNNDIEISQPSWMKIQSNFIQGISHTADISDKKMRFIPISGGNGFYISAFEDRRTDPALKILSLIRPADGKTYLCVGIRNNSTIETYGEAHIRFTNARDHIWKAAIVSCPLAGLRDVKQAGVAIKNRIWKPGKFNISQLVKVQVIEARSYVTLNDPVLSPATIKRQSRWKDKDKTIKSEGEMNYRSIAICHKPLFGVKDSSLLHFIEFIEMNKHLGVRKIIIYGFIDLEPKIKDALLYYSRMGFIHLHAFEVPIPGWSKEVDGITDPIFAQVLSIQDCLYRYMDDYDYIIFQDYDEFIIPRGNMSNFIDMFNVIESNTSYTAAAGLTFSAATMCGESNDLLTSNIMLYQPIEQKLDRQKTAVRPYLVEFMTVHVPKTTSRVLRPILKTVYVDPGIAAAHHYRLHNCSSAPHAIIDISALRFRPEKFRNYVHKTLKKIENIHDIHDVLRQPTSEDERDDYVIPEEGDQGDDRRNALPVPVMSSTVNTSNTVTSIDKRTVRHPESYEGHNSLNTSIALSVSADNNIQNETKQAVRKRSRDYPWTGFSGADFNPRNFYHLRQIAKLWKIPPTVPVTQIHKRMIEIAARGYEYGLAMVENSTNPHPNDNKYSVEVISKSHAGIVLRVTEWNVNGTVGGASFRTDIRDRNHVYTCDDEDFYNGTYLIHCPPMVVDHVVSVEIKVMYTSYQAYLFHHRRWNITIWQEKIEVPRLPSDKVTYNTPHFYPEKNSTHLSWILNGRRIPKIDKSNFNACRRQFSNFHIIGDSHSREHFKHFAWLAGYKYNFEGMNDTYEHVENGNLQFTFTKRNFDVFKLLNSTSFQKSLKPNSVLLINSLYWDLHSDFKKPLRPVKIFEPFQKTLELLKMFKSKRGVRPIWLTSPGFVTMGNFSDGKYVYSTRNNFLISAMLQSLFIQLQQAGLEMLDIFSMVQIRPNDAVCHHHYTCLPVEYNPEQLEQGPIALDILNVIINYMCNRPKWFTGKPDIV